MAEPLKQPTSPRDIEPRTARARSERDIGRSSKPPVRGERSSRKPPRPSRKSGGSSKRPRDVKAGNGARVLAPTALVIFAIACFTVLSSQDGGGTAKTSETSAGAKAAATSAAAKSGPTRSTYRVKPGDSFAAIAEAQGIDVVQLEELNPDIDPRALQPGQKLKLK